jgi:UDP-sugar transporter A1/2/3
MQAIIKKRPSRNINVQNFWLYIFGMVFNLVAICVQDFGAVINKYVVMISSFHVIYLLQFMILSIDHSLQMYHLLQRLFPWLFIYYNFDDS